MSFIKKTLHRPFFIKLLHWEYWSFNTVYVPIYFIWIGLCLRARSFFFFSAANPSILNGGFLMESKKAIYDIIPPEYYPKTIFFKRGTDAAAALHQLKQGQFTYPLIGKPDIGGRGRAVKKLNNEKDLLAYVAFSQEDFLVQEFSPYEKEAGIFYCRYPNRETGFISGVVRKEFVSVTGDGKATIRELCLREKRYILQLKELTRMYGEALHEVLPRGKEMVLVPYGNHVRGAKFIDDSALIDKRLVTSIHQVCSRVQGFYYGRLDVKFTSWEDLKQGKNFSIIELNGAGSEPTHIYDPGHSLFYAWKEIIRHWVILWRISLINHRAGIPFLTFKEGLNMFRENRAFEKKFDRHD